MDLAYIPTFPIDTCELPDVPVYFEGTLSNEVKEVLSSVAWGQSKRAVDIIFASRVMEVLDIESVNDLSYHTGVRSGMGQLIKLYLSLGTHSNEALRKKLLTEWVLATKDRSGTVIQSGKSFYSIFQSIHGDVSLTRGELSKQGDLFGNDWEDVTNIPLKSIRAYQETTPLVSALLFAYLKSSKACMEKLQQSINIAKGLPIVGCNASDAGRKEDDLQRMKFEFGTESMTQNRGPRIHYGNGECYSTSYSPETDTLIFSVLNRESSKNTTILEIPTIDIPEILPTLCMFTGRSGDTGRLLIEWCRENFYTITAGRK